MYNQILIQQCSRDKTTPMHGKFSYVHAQSLTLADSSNIIYSCKSMRYVVAIV